MEVKTKVIELEPSWLFVWFQGPKPPEEQREFWIRQTLSDWLSEHPHSIQRMLPVEHNGELLGIHVWLGDPTDVPAVKLHPALASVPKEHLEALVEHAQQIYLENLGVAGVVVVSRGGTAVVFSHERGYALPFQEFARDLEGADRRNAEEWLARPNSNYFVLHLASAWVPHAS